MAKSSDAGIPVLTDVVADSGHVERGRPSPSEALVAELQTRLAAETYALAEELMRGAFAEMEAHLLEQISRRLRAELPELIDRVLRQHLDTDSEIAE